jgi:CRISPR-associated protein Csd1
MILQALNDYYERLKEDPDSGVAPIGYSPQKISLCIVINKKGELIQFRPETRMEGKKALPKIVQVLGNSKPTGAGINPCTLWDNAAYLLGYKLNDDKPEKTQKCFEASRQYHLDLEKEINDPAFTAVCNFLKSWNPSDADSHAALKDAGTGFLVFNISGEERYVHQIPEIRKWWEKQLRAETKIDEDANAFCLVTGESLPIARLHEPKIKGVMGAQSAGAAIVSFNASAYESYGKEQSYNAPVSEQAAFQYCTALNYLLARENKRRMIIGDATVVFWTEKPTPTENIFSMFMDPGEAKEDEALKLRLEKSLINISQGIYPAQEFGDPETKFYILGLSPNAARLSVRFWYVSTLKEILDHLHQHMQDLELCGKPEKEYAIPALWHLLSETARESKDIPPLLSGAVMKSIITGLAYPQMLYGAILRRIRMDREVNYRRCSIIKAYLNRQFRFQQSQCIEKEITVSLNPNYPDPAYHMGRLFAALEKAQEDALPSINDTIKDRFFGSASATPAAIFPRLIRLSQHHQGKLTTAAKIHTVKRIQSICEHIQKFPAHMSLNQQGLFALGYYHQRQDFFTKKSKPEETEVTA